MCGPSAAQQGLQTSQLNFMTQLMSENSTVFGQSQGILGQLNGMFSGILAKGPNQQGMSATEKQVLETQANEGTATNYQQAKQALQETEAARGGGNSYAPGGESNELQAELASAGANSRSQQQQQIEQADYSLGRQNFYNAAGVLGSTAAQLNPTGFANSATGAGSAAGTTANQITQAQMSPWNTAISALGGIASSAVKMSMGPAGMLLPSGGSGIVTTPSSVGMGPYQPQ